MTPSNLKAAIAAYQAGDFDTCLKGTKYQLGGYTGVEQLNDCQRLLCGHELNRMVEEDAKANAAKAELQAAILANICDDIESLRTGLAFLLMAVKAQDKQDKIELQITDMRAECEAALSLAQSFMSREGE